MKRKTGLYPNAYTSMHVASDKEKTDGVHGSSHHWL